ncbi:hypothetical protein [Halomonas elongata]|uniref:hypothetical protein n=1 Tax=Halomonas elongata TaxID=2746 RepID=UPI00186B8D99|nr:hypothetical protein [Halomonas elongata]MBW5800054.1 hypothetical protein [Halomonas elongata]
MSECYVGKWKLKSLHTYPENGHLQVEFIAGDSTGISARPDLPDNFRELTIQQLAEIGAEQAKEDI